MWQLQVLLIDYSIPDHDQIHVESTRSPPVAAADTTVGILDRKCPLHQGSRLERGLCDHHDVEELRTVRRTPDGPGLVYRRNIHHDHVGGIAQGVDGTLYVAKPIPQIRADGVDDLAQRFHAAQGVRVDGMRIRTAHVVLLLVSVTVTSATSTGIGACGLCTVTSTHWTAS